ncbi:MULTISPECIES: DUF1289 domain-containing protein [Alteromonadaceae]|uniref:DUF1289 domain-containing protein n=1 Tax=Alteromonadaceae TaxID=72275 RepID=UPI001C09277B|nr:MULTISPECIES: DUF1289 domain-containing protein [Aliiglaciecola]MBU2878460.1 DUF1289 domain-containing protein [Aliiglaciecola lipolytica]MDO6713320.1 DUF1289 domain-containing protein [Aliiglaciecola sp. 2_MG-2023]MDO6754510.1 DUF1289 domain-containing protein [Aliiglaciecola sp. 1_MG-2023]
MKLQSKNISSPCIRNCCLDQHDVCLGCNRSLEEILIWGSADDEQKINILLNTQKRENQRNKVPNNRS